jgi:hypothetical protein
VKAPVKKTVNNRRTPSIFIVSAADNVNRVDGVKICHQNYLEATLCLINLELLAWSKRLEDGKHGLLELSS